MKNVRTVIHSPNGPNVPAPLAHAVRVDNLVYVSGLPPYYGDKPRQFVPDDFAAQFRQSMENLKNVLKDAGSSLADIVKMNVLVTRQEDFPVMNQLYRTYFEEGNYPARTTTICGLGIPGILIELECVALAREELAASRETRAS